MIKSKELSDPQSCMSRARDDEMTFVLLARDLCAALEQAIEQLTADYEPTPLDGRRALLDKLNDVAARAERCIAMSTDLAASQPPAGKGVVQAKCSECGKQSTPDSMWALYCLDCIGRETRKALAQGGPRAFNPSGDGSTPSERSK
jgi:hypothetical protein